VSPACAVFKAAFSASFEVTVTVWDAVDDVVVAVEDVEVVAAGADDACEDEPVELVAAALDDEVVPVGIVLAVDVEPVVVAVLVA
jgi:hypothetical protein